MDLSFAPVLDVLSCDSEVIGDRAFHSDPEAVHVLASAYIGGMHEAGMAAVGKHFPGHGGIGADSHTSLPEDRRSLDDLRVCDLVPYSSLADRLGGVMLAHVAYPGISPQVPSYSSFWIRNVLKDELGFRGAVFSDDLSMAGAGADPLAQRCRSALGASCDLLIVCHELPAVDELMSDVRNTWAPENVEATIQALYAHGRPLDPQAVQAARASVERASSNMG